VAGKHEQVSVETPQAGEKLLVTRVVVPAKPEIGVEDAIGPRSSAHDQLREREPIHATMDVQAQSTRVCDHGEIFIRDMYGFRSLRTHAKRTRRRRVFSARPIPRLMSDPASA
jgi:hypothetical protein